jgi:DNA-binding MarR family transcriptional regulator
MTGVDRLLRAYPRVFLACHVEHRRDPKTRRAISERQAQIVDHLDETEAMRLTDLARHMGVTPATMSIAVDRLARAGFVRRERDLKDRRAVRLRLTVAGARLRDASEVLDAGLAKKLLAALSPADRETSLAGLELLAGAATSLMKEKSEQGYWMRRSS